MSSALSSVLAKSLPLPRLIASIASVPFTRSLPSPAFRTVLIRPAMPSAPLIRSLPDVGLEVEYLGRADVDIERPGPRGGEPVEQYAAGGRGRVDREPLVGRCAPLTSEVSLPAPPSLRSSSSPPFQTIVSSPSPPRASSRVPAGLSSGTIRSLPAPPSSRSAASEPSSVSLPSPPSTSARKPSAAISPSEENVSSPPLAFRSRTLGRDDVDVERAGPGRRRAVEARVTRGRRRVQRERLRQRARH